MNLGDLLRRTGFRSAARVAWQEAARLYPGLVEPWLALGHLERQSEAWQAARDAYQQAIAVDRETWTAHQGVAYVLDALGEREAAAYHRDVGFGARPHLTIPYTGAQTPIRILLLASATGGDTPWVGLLASDQYQVEVVASEYWNPARALPLHDIVINAVSDADAARWAMDASDRLIRVSGRPAINPPDVLRKTGRKTVLDRLGAIDGVETAKIMRCSKQRLRECGAQPILQAGMSFPLLVRSVGHHTGRHFYRVENAHRLAEALDSLPGDAVWVVEWLDTPHMGDTPYRKFRVMMIGGRLYPVHAAWSQDWKVHYFSRAAGETGQELHDQFRRDMVETLGPRAIALLEAIQTELRLDYGGVDFDVLPDGRVRVFEANATMVVPPGAAIVSAVSQLINSRLRERR